MLNLKGPKFVQYFQPVIDGLCDLGSSAKSKEVYSWIAEHHDIPKAEIEGTTEDGQSKFENKVGWARFYLAKAGLIDTEQRGVWVLTEQGRKASLSHKPIRFSAPFTMVSPSQLSKQASRNKWNQSLTKTPW